MHINNVCPMGLGHIAAEPESDNERELMQSKRIETKVYTMAVCKKCSAFFMQVRAFVPCEACKGEGFVEIANEATRERQDASPVPSRPWKSGPCPVCHGSGEKA